MFNDKYPLVAVIMSVYKNDSNEYLSSAIDSILAQSYPCDLYIYLDGKVPDTLTKTLFSYKSVKNIYIITCNKNRGLAYALNQLIDLTLTKGYKYLARMDSDDISMPDRIAKQVNFLENQKNIDVLGGACEEFGASFALKYKSLPLTHDELKLFSIIRCPFIHPTVMFRASIFHSDIRYPTNTLLTEDMALWFILLEKNIIFANLPDILIKYRMDENTIHRRKGLSKAINEVKLRHSYMRKIKSSNFKNFFGLTIRFIFHLLPVAIIKILYKNAR